MPTHPRYRVEDEEQCIDVRLTGLDQLFDNRDPAPFRERDIDPGLVEYLLAASEDLLNHGPFRVVFWFATPTDTSKVDAAYRSHFEYELERLARRRRRERRVGLISLVVGAVWLIGLVLLAQVAGQLPSVGPILREGLTILSWVILWRPIHSLAFDWIPAQRERKVVARLLGCTVRIGESRALGDDERDLGVVWGADAGASLPSATTVMVGPRLS